MVDSCKQEVIISKARAQDDPNLCDQIEDEFGKNNCKERIYTYRAIVNKDVSICEEYVKDPSRKEQCINQASN
jgi:hypothetical protein